MPENIGRGYTVPLLNGSDEGDVPKWMQELATDISADVGEVAGRVKVLEDTGRRPRGWHDGNSSTVATSSGAADSAKRAAKTITFPPNRRFLFHYRAQVASSVNANLVRGYVYLNFERVVPPPVGDPNPNLARVSMPVDTVAENTASDWHDWVSPATETQWSVAMYVRRYAGTAAFVMDSCRWAVYDEGAV